MYPGRVLTEPAMPRRPGGWAGVSRLAGLALRSRAGTAGLLILLVLVLVAASAPWLAPLSPTAQTTSDRLVPPIWQAGGKLPYLLGTDNLGRDILSRLIYGAQISLSVGLVAVAISLVLGMPLGLLSGYRGGTWDTVIMGLAEVQLALPFILLAMAVIVIFGPSLLNTILVLGVTQWVWYGRIVRGQVLSLRERDFVTAARTVGGTGTRIVWRHILPQVVTPIVVVATLQLARMILLEASLTFLGMGVQPPTPTWGSMLADGRAFITSAWWVATLPGLAITLAVLGINLLGDGLRDLLDPRLKT